MLSHLWTKLETQKFYPKDPRSSGVYLTSNLSKTKDRAHVINLDEYKSV